MDAIKFYCEKFQGALVILIAMTMLLAPNGSQAQNKTTYMRIAKITVDGTALEGYKIALKEQMQAALRLEKGVLAYSAVQDKNNPVQITILETYASVEAYQAHIQTAHFKKYKATVANWVKHLELTDVLPIATLVKQE
ncbi:antibiotic biosynthesis monooxygenase [Solitalea longa]|uniref:Antibiotic biosynthesis monooxygenase n=1 Tax=Solitalea longa TaxID=2079460 RepID=A0A2S5A6T1_9SPHI|nr:antibiotic biosynthesis monooxygenase [Solitalea longa]POY38019.1 antibiotic biosynthesis monooxygenase [Solitalea longa]